MAGPRDVIVVRLLNGILKGCEYHLSQGKTLFIAAGSDVLDASALPSFPGDSVLIPVEGEGVNFEIVTAPATGEAVLLRVLDNAGAGDRVLETNQAFSVGGLMLAIRQGNESWADDILNFQAEKVPDPVPPRRTRRVRWMIIAAACAALVLLLLAFVGKGDARQREILALANQLSDEPEKYRILSGRDGMIHVLAADGRDASWVRQSLVRLKPPQSVNIASYLEEVRRVERWLGLNYPFLRLHQVRLDAPDHPMLFISRQRSVLDDPETTALREGLMTLLPYAQDIQIDPMDDQSVAAEAEEGIKKLAVPYTRIDNADSVTFVITGALNDGERQRVRAFVEEYDRRWNGGYVQFAVELKDDWLKGKSFKYGHHGYVKMTPGHWYFPKP